MENRPILNRITRNTGAHRFIDIKDFSNYQDIIDQLLKEYGNFSCDKPSAIYLDNYSIVKDSIKFSKEQQDFKLTLLSRYYRYLIAFNLVKHLEKASIDIEKSVLTTFRFGEKSSTIKELLEKIELDLIGFKNAYDNTDFVSQESYVPRISFLGFDTLFRNIEYDSKIKWFCNLYFNALDIDKDTAVILNDYISSRIGGLLCFNICYNSLNEYPIYIDRNGVKIQPPHDYQIIKMI